MGLLILPVSLTVFSLYFLVACVNQASASSSSFRGGARNNLRHVRDADFRAAMDLVLGCGDSSRNAERQPVIRNALVPVWKTMPKDSRGRVNREQLRYIAHRFFMQESSLLVRGFEPPNRVNMARRNSSQPLDKHVPEAASEQLAKTDASTFVFDDVVVVISALGQMIADSERGMLELAENTSKEISKSTSNSPTFGRQELFDVIEAYMVYWLLGDHGHDQAKLILEDRSLLVQALPHWQAVSEFVNGQINSWIFKQQRGAHKKGQIGRAFELSISIAKFSLDDAHEVVSHITRSFASFWETECQTIKRSLLQLDKAGNGRVRLVDFYGSNMDGEWRFGESEQYLRELGALDDSSFSRGPQVIISNYLQGTSNCIASTPHYHVCCVNECEAIQDDIERTIGAPVAGVDELLALVAKQHGYEDERIKLEGHFTAQLKRIAQLNGGLVPLHGRLFAQWLHYVFPKECPFPHKSGTVHAQTPGEYGDDYIASKEEVARHAEAALGKRERVDSLALDAQIAAEDEETLGMSQWTEDEELVGDYTQEFKAPWEAYQRSSNLLLGGGAAAVLIAIGGLVASGVLKGQSRSSRPGLDGFMLNSRKTHFV